MNHFRTRWSNEHRTGAIITAGLLVLLLMPWFPHLFDWSFHRKNYLSIHLLLEIFSVIVSISIALLGWLSYPHTGSNNHLCLGALFLAVGLLDLLHAVSFKDILPHFITENSVDKAAWFWILARLTESGGLLWLILLNTTKKANLKRFSVYFLSIGYLSVSSFIILMWSENLPPLVVEGQGATMLKRGLEYFVCILHFLTLATLMSQYQKVKDPALLDLVKAVSLLLIGEYVLIKYISDYGLNNFLGHIAAAAGYYYLLKVVYSTAINKPFEQHKRIELQLKKEKINLETITSNMGEGVFVVDREGIVTFMNPEAERLVGWKQDELIGKKLHDMIHYERADGNPHPYEECMIVKSIRQERSYRIEEDHFIHQDGTRFPVSYVTTPVFENNQVTGSVTVFRDITEQIKQQEFIKQMAYYDDLTQLPNQRLFRTRANEILLSSSRTGHKFALLLLDLDRFKIINESLGPILGDLFIKAAAQRVSNHVGDGMFFARTSGDEFGILVPHVKNEHELAELCGGLLKVFDQPLKADNYEVKLNISIGAAIYPHHGSKVEELIKNANTALSRAKDHGNYSIIFSPYMNKHSYEGLVLENELYMAFQRQEFVLFYQPQVDIFTGKISGLEALLRWNHPQRGFVSPADFIPLAEVTGLIVPIGEWVLRTACHHLRDLHDMGFDDLSISINLSMRQFYDDHLPYIIKEILQETSIPPHRLELEITESMTMNVDFAKQFLSNLKKLGIKISIDDFGTGYSSLSYLKELPIDRLKIDQSFIRDLFIDSNDAAIVSTIISMAHHLDLDVVAEGVETKNQLLFLLNEQCNLVQGYLLGRPLPFDELESRLIDMEKSAAATLAKDCTDLD